MESRTAHERIDMIEARMGWPTTNSAMLPDSVKDQINKEIAAIGVGPLVADGAIKTSLYEFHDALLKAFYRVAQAAHYK